MTRVVAPSRLHFGLLRVPPTPDAAGPRFGGCGLMIDSPGVAVRVEPADAWSGDGPSAERAVAFARRVTADPHRVTVERCPPEHVGLGVGTALGLAVAKAIHPELSAVELAPVVGRGERSGVGLHGFDRGGLIVDGGKELPGELPRLAGRYDFPADWRIVLAIPPRAGRWAGDRERAAFDRPRSPNEGRIAERMERLLAGEMLPGLRGGDGARFGAALHEYNRLAGLPFVADQGGVYVSWEVAELIAAVRTLGVAGVGQSSWGPAVFAVVPDPDRAAEVVREVRHRFGTLAVDVARAALAGAVMSA